MGVYIANLFGFYPRFLHGKEHRLCAAHPLRVGGGYVVAVVGGAIARDFGVDLRAPRFCLVLAAFVPRSPLVLVVRAPRPSLVLAVRAPRSRLASTVGVPRLCLVLFLFR